MRVTSHVARTKRRGFARIYGTVTPGVIGAQVGILRIAQGHGILAGGTIVKPLNSISGQFSRVVRVQRGVYRVLIKVAPGGVVSAYGTPLLDRLNGRPSALASLRARSATAVRWLRAR